LGLVDLCLIGKKIFLKEKKFPKPPKNIFRAILSNKTVLIVWLNSFADIVTAVFLITYLPTYVSKVLRYGVRETGIWSAVPALLHIPVKIGSGWLADNMR